MQNSQMTNYIMPTSSDLPPIRVFFEELGNVHGAFGAKGIGELPMDGPAPAILNAVEDALGIRLQFDSVAAGRYLRGDYGDTLSRRIRCCERSSMISSSRGSQQVRDFAHGERRAKDRARLSRWSGCSMCCGNELGLTGREGRMR